MKTKAFKTLSIAASSGKVGFVFLIENELLDWGLSVKASKSPELAAKQAKKWIDYYQPDLIITEKITTHSRKSAHNHAVIRAIADEAVDADAQHIEVDRVQEYANKYAEAEALGAIYPTISNWVPKKRKLWEAEPKNMVLFEALSFMK